MKYRPTLLGLFLFAAASALPLAAQSIQTNEARLSGGVTRGFAGRTVNVPWFLGQTGSVSGVQFDLTYPSNKLSAGVFQKSTLSNNVVFRWRQIAPGQHRVLFYSRDRSALSTNINIGSLPFTIPPSDYQGGGRVTINGAVVSRTNAVAAAPVQLNHGGVIVSPLFRGDDGVVDLMLTVQPNRTYVVQATTNLVNWVNISTNFASLDYIIATDAAAAAYNARFYRAAPVTALPFDNTLKLNVVSNRTYVLQASTNLMTWVNLSTNFTAQNFIVVNDAAWLFYPMRFYRAALLNSTSTGSSISNLQLQPGNQIVFGYGSAAGRAYVLQSSTNLTTWNNVTTNVAGGTLLNFTNLIAPGVSRQFFRIMELP